MKREDGLEELVEFRLPLPLGIAGPLLRAIGECLEREGWTHVSLTTDGRHVVGRAPAPAQREWPPTESIRVLAGALSPLQAETLAELRRARSMELVGPTRGALNRRALICADGLEERRRVRLTRLGERVADIVLERFAAEQEATRRYAAAQREQHR